MEIITYKQRFLRKAAKDMVIVADFV